MGVWSYGMRVVETMIPYSVWIGAAALLGAMVGSFLNVCIYRLPRDLSVWKPSRSFCPGCKELIPWWRNIPVFSWLMLRARCPDCGGAISGRYILVEVLTSALFAWVASRSGFDATAFLLFGAYATLVALLVVATFVDLEHFIIPDEVSVGGVAAGVIWSALVPKMHSESSLMGAALVSLSGALCGYGILWAVVELGRIVFGRRKLRFEKPVAVTWERSGSDASIDVDGEVMSWSEFFFRGNESLKMEVVNGECDGAALEQGIWSWSLNSLHAGACSLDLNCVSRISATVTAMVIPREVMGFGDVKLLAAIGAFLGWRAVLFVLFAGATVGSVIGLIGALTRRREWSARIPFGPYLALGALLWLAAGPQCLSWYWTALELLLRKAP
jgi:leader peptidase (prepilin peptidase)/N-methyltransferase